MNLIYARVVELYPEEGEPMGKVSVWGVQRAVPLHLVPEARPGDTVLVCDGVAIGKVDEEAAARTYANLKEMNPLSELEADGPEWATTPGTTRSTP